jgi:ATP-dependent RNA helicase DeaD
LVFCNTKRKADELAKDLQMRGYRAAAIHGDLNQSQRERVLSKFRKLEIEILTATDVAARGLDIDDIDIVFNYDVPKDDEDYVHRIGRTGRAGKEGKAFSFASGKDIYKLKEIQKYTKANIVRKAIPTLLEVENVKAVSILEDINAHLDDKDIDKYARMINTFVSDDVTSLDVAAVLLKMRFSQDKQQTQPEKKNTLKSQKETSGDMVRLFINVGKKDKIRAGDIVGAIAGETGMDAELIGNIKLLDSFSFVEVPSEYADDVISALNDSNIRGRKVSADFAR